MRKAPSRRNVLLAWSSGKDSAWMLHLLRRREDVEITGLLTTVRRRDRRVVMHATPEALLDAQARAVGLPLRKVFLPDPCPNEVYEAAMREEMERAVERGVTHVAFGDLFLEDIRRYREERLAGTGIMPLFPLWGYDTRRLARDMVDAGLRACVTCVDSAQLDPDIVGCSYDHTFLDALPPGVDPCGEYGEFHTFAWAGPMFAYPISVERRHTYREGAFARAELDLAATDT